MKPTTIRIALAGGSVALAGAATAAVIAGRRRRADVVPDDLVLPDGEAIKIDTPDGAVLSGTVAGEGPTVVLAHCWTGNQLVWAPVARRLVASGHRVVLYDQRGHGDSTVGLAGCTIETLGDDLAAVLEKVDARDAVVAGHSMGGMSVQAFAAAHPDVVAARVARIALVATAATGVGIPRARALAEAAVGGRAVERALSSSFGHRFVRGSVGRRPQRAHLVLTRDAFTATPGHVRKAFLHAMHDMDLRAGLAAVDVPTVVVCGERDRLTPLSLARTLAGALPGAELVVVPDAGHMLPLEVPEVIADILANPDR